MPTSPCLVVRTPGRLTTVQDAGRWGWQHLGVPVGGPMDALAFRRANRLVGNDAFAAGLEMTLDGPTVEFVGPATVAIAGAAASAHLNGVRVPAECAFDAPHGGVLEVGPLSHGARACLAVAGGLETPLVLGSRATTLAVLGGRPLRAGDVLPIGLRPAGDGRVPGATRQHGARPRMRQPQGAIVLRVLPGPDVGVGAGDERSGEVGTALASLCEGDYVLDAQSNRMGYRLTGPIVHLGAGGSFSAGTVMGMVQVPPDGQPILLMADRQTTGGYPVVGVVIAADLPHAGQLAPGDRCRFTLCTRRDAMAALLLQERDVLGG